MKKSGFTIAEALITLAIIGVVAALVIPTIVSNYRKQVYVTTLSKAVSDFETAMSVMIMKEGKNTLFQTNALSSIAEKVSLGSESDDDVIQKFVGNIGGTLGLLFNTSVKSATDLYGEKIHNLDGSEIDTSEDVVLQSVLPLNTKNEVTYLIYINNLVEDSASMPEQDALAEGTNLTEKVADVLIDVNAAASPNIIGRDIFYYVLGSDGRLYPEYGHDFCVYNEEEYEDVGKKCVTDQEGKACGAYLMNNGYRMDY